MFLIKKIENKNIWNNFLIENEFDFSSFLSSWQWGEFQKKSKKEVFRFGIYKNQELIGVLPLILNKAKRGTYFFAPHSPMILNKYNFFDVIGDIKNRLIKLGKQNGADFIRFNSPLKNTKDNKNSFSKLGFIDSPMHEHAEDTNLLDLKKSVEELLKNIKKGDRYYINRAIKEGVEIKKGNTKENIKILEEMHRNHSKKVGYHAFSMDFIEKLYDCFSDNITTISASYNGKVESILMTIQFGKTCVYYIAASDIISHKFSPNYLCQWEAIKDAKEKGCTIYNFWGVSPDENPKHPIAGVTKFKRKFGGYDYSLLHSQDLIITKKYFVNYIVEYFRRIKRGYYYKKPE